MAVTESPSRAPGMATPEEKRMDGVLSHLIVLSQQVRSAVDEVGSFRSECSELGKQADCLSDMLRSLARFTASAPSLYERPIHCVATEASRNLKQALALARKCKRHNIVRRVVNMASAADFKKITALLDASLGNLKWLLSVFDFEGEGGDIEFSLHPIEINDPILACVWSLIASLHMGPLPIRIEAANELASIARDNDRNKMIIVEEGGLPPLLKLLKESSAPDAREEAMTALHYLANDQRRAQAIVNELGVETILQILPSLAGVRTTLEDRQSQPPPDQIIKANDGLSKRTRNLPDGGMSEVSDRGDLHAVHRARDIFDTNGAFLLTEALDSSSVPIAFTESLSQAPGMAAPEEKRMDRVLSNLIVLSQQVRSVVDEAGSFRSECSELGKQADCLSDMLRSLARFTASAPSLYERPIHCVATEASRNLKQALALARKCKRHNIVRRVVNMASAADFKKITALLDASLGNLKWLLSVFDFEGEGGDIEFSLHPIEINDPILACVWSLIASLHMGPLPIRIEAANELASIARDNDRNKMIIVEEGGLPPLLKLLKESSAPNAREAAMTVLHYMANDQGRAQAIVNELGVETFLQILPSLAGVRTTIEDQQSQPPPDQIIKANDGLSKRTRNLPDGGMLEVSDRGDLHAVHCARDIFDTNGAFLLTEALDSSSVPIAVTELLSRAPGMAAPEEKRMDRVLSNLIVLSQQVRSVVDEAGLFRSECSELGKQADCLSDMLRSLACFTASAPSLYERPIRCIATEASRNLKQALALARKCKRHNIVRHVVHMTSAADFKKITALLDASLGNMKWLLSVFDLEGEGGDIDLSLHPIEINDPILACVWSLIASLHMGSLPIRIEAANELASIARDNDRSKMIIVEEGGLPPLLKLLKESSAPNAREAAMTVLHYLANDQGRAQAIVNELGVETFLQILPSLAGVRTTIEDQQSQPPPDQIIKANDDLSRRTR